MPLPHTVIASAEWIKSQPLDHWLTADELTVYTAWRFEKRQAEWLAGRMAAKRLLWEEIGLEPCRWQIGRDGVAPAILGSDVPPLALSLSHSAGQGAATLADTRTEGSAGIDIQRIRLVHPGLCVRVFTSDEQEQIAARFGASDDPAGMLLFWALKEAAIKARREAWGRSLQSLHVRLSIPGFATVFLENEPPLASQYERLGDWWLARVVKPPKEQPPSPNTGA